MLQFSDVSTTWYVLNNLVQYAELCSLARVRSNYLFLEVVRTIISVIEETKGWCCLRFFSSGKSEFWWANQLKFPTKVEYAWNKFRFYAFLEWRTFFFLKKATLF